MSVNLSGSRRSVPALRLFEGAQTETVRLRFDASASSASLQWQITSLVSAAFVTKSLL